MNHIERMYLSLRIKMLRHELSLRNATQMRNPFTPNIEYLQRQVTGDPHKRLEEFRRGTIPDPFMEHVKNRAETSRQMLDIQQKAAELKREMNHRRSKNMTSAEEPAGDDDDSRAKKMNMSIVERLFDGIHDVAMREVHYSNDTDYYITDIKLPLPEGVMYDGLPEHMPPKTKMSFDMYYRVYSHASHMMAYEISQSVALGEFLHEKLDMTHNGTDIYSDLPNQGR